MAMTQRARNLFKIPASSQAHYDGLITTARAYLRDARDYISVHDFKNALSAVAEGQRILFKVPFYTAVRDQLDDAQKKAQAGIAKGLR